MTGVGMVVVSLMAHAGATGGSVSRMDTWNEYGMVAAGDADVMVMAIVCEPVESTWLKACKHKELRNT